MKNTDRPVPDGDLALDFDAFDESNDRLDREIAFNQVITERRRFINAVGGAVSFSALAPSAFSAGTGAARNTAGIWLDFEPVAANSLATITLPNGFHWYPLIRWGDPLWSDQAPFDQLRRGTAASQRRAFGDGTDGMKLFEHDGKVTLAVNNEFANRHTLFGRHAPSKPQNADDVAKSQAAHGVSVFELQQHNRRWSAVLDAPVNRRITAETPMDIVGPARGHVLLRTAADPSGKVARGTWNNCGCGRTPWGSYLTCEENFNGYFSSRSRRFKASDEFLRYGLNGRDWGYDWASADSRFDLSEHPNEANRVGYVVEINVQDATSTPKKRTALGRLKHENAELVLASDGRVVVYMGDDERGEYLYRYVSTGTWRAGQPHDDLLNDGQLSVARFDSSGKGRWLALSTVAAGMDDAQICIHTRLAASRVGGTTMDRPEWVAANPARAEVYCSLTNNKYRGRRKNAGGDNMPVFGPNPRANNRYGQIVRWRPEGQDHGAEYFDWDLFVVAGNPSEHQGEKAGSSNINAGNMFNSPDGISFDSRGGLWILTDGKDSDSGDFSDQGNNQLLLSDPVSGDIRRFMVGPHGCEVTGICWSPDKRTLFVGIQHPGGHFPDGGDTVARSTIVAIARDDDGPLG